MSYIISRPLGGSCGIGHQFHNWQVAWLLSNHYDIKFVHAPFCGTLIEPQIDTPVEQWEKFLGFGKTEILEQELPKNIKKIQLPHIDWTIEPDEFDHLSQTWGQVTCFHPIWREIIEKNVHNLVLFECYKHQFIQVDWKDMRSNILRERYSQSFHYQNVKNLFDNTKINVAIHIRRGDITENGRYKVRWVGDDVYLNIITKLSDLYKNNIIFHIYTDGTIQQFNRFKGLNNTILHIKENIFQTFHSMVIADILVTGQSSFSSLAGHICGGIKLARPWCPYWSNFPSNQKFIEVGRNGEFNEQCLDELLRSKT